MVKTKLTFFQMKVKSVFWQSVKAYKTRFCKNPKAFNAVNVRVFISKFVVTVLYHEILLTAQVYKAIVTAPVI